MPRRGVARFNLCMSIPPKISGLSPAELQRLVVQLLEDVAELKRVVAEQRKEIARLKGLKGRPNIKPSGMENASTRKSPQNGKRQRRGKSAPRAIIEQQVLKALAPAIVVASEKTCAKIATCH